MSGAFDVAKFERTLQDLARALERRRDPRRYGVNCALIILWSMRDQGSAGADAIRALLEEPLVDEEAVDAT